MSRSEPGRARGVDQFNAVGRFVEQQRAALHARFPYRAPHLGDAVGQLVEREAVEAAFGVVVGGVEERGVEIVVGGLQLKRREVVAPHLGEHGQPIGNVHVGVAAVVRHIHAVADVSREQVLPMHLQAAHIVAQLVLGSARGLPVLAVGGELQEGFRRVVVVHGAAAEQCVVPFGQGHHEVAPLHHPRPFVLLLVVAADVVGSKLIEVSLERVGRVEVFREEQPLLVLLARAPTGDGQRGAVGEVPRVAIVVAVEDARAEVGCVEAFALLGQSVAGGVFYIVDFLPVGSAVVEHHPRLAVVVRAGDLAAVSRCVKHFAKLVEAVVGVVLRAGLREGVALVGGGVDASAAVKLVVGVEDVAAWCDEHSPHAMVQAHGFPLRPSPHGAEEERRGQGRSTHDVVS